MKWSLRIATVAGIAVYVHATFAILILWVALAHWQVDRSAAAAVSGVAFVLALFACVVLHELGHALTAARFGIRTRDITLLPIGGIARLERMPDDPRQELWVALAGPAVNVVIAGVLFVALWSTGSLSAVERVSLAESPFAERLMIVNVFLAAFNMLPAFPMDGGRVLRAALALRLDYARATQLAAGVGQAMALFFGLLGLFGNPFLIFIALFVWIGASQEAAMTQVRSVLSGIPLEHAIVTDFHVVAPTDALQHAVDLLLSGTQQDFPVVDATGVVGLLGRADLIAALSRVPRESPVAEAMRHDVPAVDVSEALDVALERLRASGSSTMPVTRGGALVGLLTLENVGELVSVRSAIDGAGRAGRARPPAIHS